MAATSMTKNERIKAALAGENVDRVPISYWCHFPKQDETVEDLVNATLSFYRAYDIDLIKLMPTGMYSVIDYGTEIELQPGLSGTTQMKSTPISSAAAWATLPKASPDAGVLANQVEVVRRVRTEVGDDVPILQTLFSPLTMANKMVNDDLYAHIESNEADLQKGLERFADDIVAFGKACLDAGADGFFFASQHANYLAPLSGEQFERLGVNWDTQILGELAKDNRNWFSMLHLHGEQPRFELAQRYPVHAVNWHDRESPPSIKEALDQTDRCLIAGIKRQGAINSSDIRSAVQEVDDAIAQANGRRLIVAPGCVVPYNAPAETLKAVRQRVEAPENV